MIPMPGPWREGEKTEDKDPITNMTEEEFAKLFRERFDLTNVAWYECRYNAFRLADVEKEFNVKITKKNEIIKGIRFIAVGFSKDEMMENYIERCHTRCGIAK